MVLAHLAGCWVYLGQGQAERSCEAPSGALPRYGYCVTPAQVEESRAKLDVMAGEAGRDPASLTITVYGQDPNHALLQSLINAGANRVVIRPEHCDTEEEMGRQLESIAEAVLR